MQATALFLCWEAGEVKQGNRLSGKRGGEGRAVRPDKLAAFAALLGSPLQQELPRDEG